MLRRMLCLLAALLLPACAMAAAYQEPDIFMRNLQVSYDDTTCTVTLTFDECPDARRYYIHRWETGANTEPASFFSDEEDAAWRYAISGGTVTFIDNTVERGKVYSYVVVANLGAYAASQELVVAAMLPPADGLLWSNADDLDGDSILAALDSSDHPLPLGYRLVLEVLTSPAAELTTQLDRNLGRAVYYRVSLLDYYGRTVQPDAPMPLLLPLPDGWTAAGTQTVYLMAGADEALRETLRTVNGRQYVTVTANRLGVFVLTAPEEEIPAPPATGDAASPALWLLAACAALALLRRRIYA